MTAQNVIEQLGLDRVVSIDSDFDKLSESQAIVLNQAKEKKFGIDDVYFCTDKNGNSYPAVFIKKVSSFDTETLEKISNTHKQIWNYKKVIFLYVYSETEIRIYNCAEQPLIVKKENFDYNKELEKLEIKSYKFSDKKNLEELNTLFSSVAIDTGIIWTIEEADSIRKKINLQRRVDKYLVESLVNIAKQLEGQGLKIDFIHKIIMRSLFLLYLEDRGATDEIFYSQIKKGTKSYFDILEDEKATYDLFEKLEGHFNGNVFTIEEGESISVEQLRIIKKCFISGNDNTPQTQLFEDWKLFNFSIIQIELLSEIYENFIFAINPEQKQQTGTYYTPPSLVELILNEKLPINSKESEYKLKILDPSCGSGIFLVESYKRLVTRYENKHKEKLTDFNKLKQLLTDNIFGIEIHPQSIKVAAFSLYLALVDNLNPKTIWQDKGYRLPYLINDPEDKSIKQQGKNLYCRDTININKEIESIKFDLVLGNPPFGTDNLFPSIRNYCDKYGFAKEMVLPFLHKATDFSPNGEIVLIFNTKVLTNTGTTYQNFRRWLFNECYVEKIYNFSILRNAPKNFGGQLFGSATGPISIVFYRKEKPKNVSDKIIYYAPKTYIKSNVIEGVAIDSTDVKYLPREECQKPDTKIWKIAMWGGMGDWNIINKIFNNTISLDTYFKKETNKWKEPRVGLNGDSEKPDFIPVKIINPRSIQRYYTPDITAEKNEKYYRNIDKHLFEPPFVILKKGQHKKQITASYIDYFSYCTTSCYIFNGDVSKEEKKVLVCLLNSKITTYFLFMVGSSWGIEREQIFKDEVLEMPALLPLIRKDVLDKITNAFDKILEIKNQFVLNSEYLFLEDEIDKLIFTDVLRLTHRELTIINDCLNFNLNLFENKEKSKILLPVSFSEIEKYGKLICSELIDFLEGQDIYANATTFNIQRFSPLMMIKISFDSTQKKIFESQEFVNNELKKLDKQLWEKEATNIYFRKKLNYKIGDDVYIIRPNQHRFWSQSMALEDASELILEILNEN